MKGDELVYVKGGEGADVKGDEGIDVNGDKGADVNSDKGADVNSDKGSDVNSDKGADVNGDKSADVKGVKGDGVKGDEGVDVNEVRHVECISLLLEHGANVNQTGKYNESPLMASNFQWEHTVCFSSSAKRSRCEPERQEWHHSFVLSY